MFLVNHDSQPRIGTGVIGCLSDPGSSHDDRPCAWSSLRSVPLSLQETLRVAEAGGAEHPESAMRSLSFELMSVDAQEWVIRARCAAATVQQPESKSPEMPRNVST